MFAEPGYRWPVLVSAGATVLGFTGVATLATLATTQSDVLPGLAALIALALWLHLERAQRNTVWTALALGGLAGVSVGLKLTQAPLFIGMLAAIAIRLAIGKTSALIEAIAFGAGGLCRFRRPRRRLAVGQFQGLREPIFPIMNNVFKSDLVDLGEMDR